MINSDIDVQWRDVKEWTATLEITHGLMLKKFYPHFNNYEDDLMQEMMIVLIKAIKRIKKGEITSQKNYVITVLKYAAYKMAKKLIDYDKNTFFLEDLKSNLVIDSTAEWLDLFDLGIVDYESVFSVFETVEERYMIMVIIKRNGYSRRGARELLDCEWDYILKLEKRVKEKLIEVIKMYTT